ncbi:Rho-binding antiterminator [Vibrio anguillarum]|uniref:Rho-binding antiterminator n=2 Tax=Vibrio TaxID=662 RepID=A0A191W953_VIBAN|nr:MULTISPECIES: Rho-binding antiterminator [Vibrio]ASG02174.1 transcriptional antiterminator [Vibrio anguillarum]ASG05901.1 transcriptional antiterminator [Vibrio anguillarum]ASO30624.1 transcriptional antiterminator [Vibrio anguillarum]ASW83277.1 transcriptional antiterminator [Vibrio anguillarum]ATC59778.1 transcriptional antiterminator [Vibrio anguillarum]
MVTCSQYDYIELACLFHLPVKLTLKNGLTYSGTAMDTLRNEHQQECIVLKNEQSEHLIETNALLMMEALSSHPHFTLIKFD